MRLGLCGMNTTVISKPPRGGLRALKCIAVVKQFECVNVICHPIDRYRPNMGYPCMLIIWLTRFQILGRKTAYGKGLADRL